MANRGAKRIFSLGDRVRVIRGRQFQHFGAGDAGRVVQVDKASETCDVAFYDSKETQTVAFRYLEADATPSPPGSYCPTPTPDRERSEADEDVHMRRERCCERDRRWQQRRGVAEVLRDVRRVREGNRPVNGMCAQTCPNCDNIYMPDSVFCRNCGQKRDPSSAMQAAPASASNAACLLTSRAAAEAADALFDRLDANRDGVITREEFEAAQQQGAVHSGANAAGQAINEAASLKVAFRELRESILQEAEQRISGMKEFQSVANRDRDGIFEQLAQEQRRLDDKQAELVALCQSLQNLKDSHSSFDKASAGDLELRAPSPLTARIDVLDERMSVLDGRLAALASNVSPLIEVSSSTTIMKTRNQDRALEALRRDAASKASNAAVDELAKTLRKEQEEMCAKMDQRFKVFVEQLEADVVSKCVEKSMAAVFARLDVLEADVVSKCVEKSMAAVLDRLDALEVAAQLGGSTAGNGGQGHHSRRYLDARTEDSAKVKLPVQSRASPQPENAAVGELDATASAPAVQLFRSASRTPTSAPEGSACAVEPLTRDASRSPVRVLVGEPAILPGRQSLSWTGGACPLSSRGPAFAGSGLPFGGVTLAASAAPPQLASKSTFSATSPVTSCAADGVPDFLQQSTAAVMVGGAARGWEAALGLSPRRCEAHTPPRLQEAASLTAGLVSPRVRTTCPNCGNTYMPDSHYCRRCGQRREITQAPLLPLAAPLHQAFWPGKGQAFPQLCPWSASAGSSASTPHAA